ncbi:exodeoxyribonuclease VII large subunit [Aliikangiella maris]|uniref:Exodeoxyribonuclease VII large subunit n=2 Tax=Aliikangiella maris TaxID=3162458 RepID=A0ABV3MRJ2_9GAMM
MSQLNAQSKSLLEGQLGAVWLSGEISNLTKAVSGHWYFSLKDANAQVRCAMFRFKTQNLRFSPKEGDKVIIKGKVTLYEARGDFQIIADFMEPDGMGLLQQQLNELVNKLKSEGLLAVEHKQSLPLLPKKIGVITSATGAAIHDVLHVLARRCPMVPVVIYPTQVQGATAAKEISNALQLAINQHTCDVLLLTRGGGSLEDLWCFNDEKLAREIFDCPIPIVAAVGHEVDTTVAELVADLRAPTPSAAAELLVPEQQVLQQKIDLCSLQMMRSINDKLDRSNRQLQLAQLKLADPARAIATSQHKLDLLSQKLMTAQNRNIQQQQKRFNSLQQKFDRINPIVQLKNTQQQNQKLQMRLENVWYKLFEKKVTQLRIQAGALNNLSPLSTLHRGYAIARTTDKKSVISQVKQLRQHSQFSLMLSDGEIECEVKN